MLKPRVLVPLAAVVLLSALVGAKVALEARLGAPSFAVPDNSDITGGDLVATYPLLPPAADWAAPVGAVLGAALAVAVAVLVGRASRRLRDSWSGERPLRTP